MRETLAGTGVLVRLGLRRDRWLLSLWILAFAVMASSSASAGAGLFPDLASRIEAARTMNGTASMVALFGRIYDPSSLGALSLIKYTAFMTAALAALMVFVTIRHTRAEEESGRLELLSGGRLGRNASLAAALTISFAASLLVGLLTAAGLAAGGLPAAGSLAFGLGWAATGMAFSAVAGVTAQLTTSSRAATGLGMIVIAITYVLRAFGDLAGPGPSFLSWLSPIGWNQQIRAYAGDQLWVLVLPLALCAVVVFEIGYRLFGRTAGVLAALLWMTYPVNLIIAVYQFSEVPFQLLLGGPVLVSLHTMPEHRTRRGWASRPRSHTKTTGSAREPGDLVPATRGGTWSGLGRD